MNFSEEYDVVVLGAGAGGMSAAAVAAAEGLKVLLVEKSDRIGGTTAISGGMVWVPNNAKMKAMGVPDSEEQAMTYLRATVPDETNMEGRLAYLRTAPKAIEYLEARTTVKLQPVQVYPDYYPDLPGATTGCRVLEPVPYDGTELGADFDRLRDPLPEFTLFGGMMIARPDIVHFRNVYKSAKSALRVLQLVADYGRQRLKARRGTTLVLGNALAARLFRSILDLGVTIRTGTVAERLIETEGRVAGVELKGPSGSTTIGARRGVVIATGGFSHNQERRQQYLPPEAGALSATWAGDTGDGLSLAETLGAQVRAANSNNALWTPVSVYERPDGSRAVFPHTVTDRAKPGAMAVNQAGRRFANEAQSYHEFVQAMFRAHRESPAIPAYLIGDKTFLWKYGMGAVKPMSIDFSRFKKIGYLIEAPSVATLAEKLGIDTDALRATVSRYNIDAVSGVDTEFGRGRDAYQRFLGDAACKPNPCMRPMETAPFYAVKLYPADLGTSGGLVADRSAQVLREDGAPIPGLYACGNDLNSIMNGAYPGPGITLGPALVFGYIAAMHMAHGDNAAGADA